MAEKDPFQNMELQFWGISLAIFIPIYMVIFYPLNFLVGIVFGILTISNTTLLIASTWLIHAISIVCAAGAIYSCWKVFRSDDS